MEQGREVFAVPGPIDSRMSRGCHKLIRDGAKLVESIDDVIEELGPLMAPLKNSNGETIHHPAELNLNVQETAILQAVETSPTDIDTIVQRTELPVTRVLSTISVLEIRKLIRRVSGSAVVRIS
jgi:DNA processing protein